MREKGIHNFTPSERELIREIVLDGICQFQLNEQILMDIEAKAKVSISINTLYHIKQSIMEDCNKLVEVLKRKDGEFLKLYMETVLRIENLIKHQWMIYNITNNLGLKSVCLDRIQNYTLVRHKLYDFLPTLCACKPFQDAVEMIKIKYGGSYPGTDFRNV